jgi:hypothetical protein
MESAWELHQFLHFRSRMRSRYFRDVTREQYDMLNKDIVNERALYAGRYPRNSRFEIYIIAFKGKEVCVGYDRIHKRLSTALPFIALQHYKRIAMNHPLKKDTSKSKLPTIDHTELLEKQGGMCALCRKNAWDSKQGLRFDNSEDRNSLALLCGTCTSIVCTLRKHGIRPEEVSAYERSGRTSTLSDQRVFHGC